MIITEQKQIAEILESIKDYHKLFLIGCGECATVCKTGGETELREIKIRLEQEGKAVLGMCIPESTCVSSKLKTELAKNSKTLREIDAILVFSCGLGVQSVKENERLGLNILPGCNSLFGALLDSQGNFYEKCLMCAQCVLEFSGGICPVTLCAKGLLNGPCGGMNKGKCEVDNQKDCAWVLIYKELQKKNKTARLRQIRQPRDHKKSLKPGCLIINKI